jgi:hypothetical protein
MPSGMPQAALLARLHSLLKNAGFVSGHRFSDAVTAAKSAAPSGAELPDQSSTAGNEHTKSPPHQSWGCPILRRSVRKGGKRKLQATTPATFRSTKTLWRNCVEIDVKLPIVFGEPIDKTDAVSAFAIGLDELNKIYQFVRYEAVPRFEAILPEIAHLPSRCITTHCS